jgi:hypothetical protein
LEWTFWGKDPRLEDLASMGEFACVMIIRLLKESLEEGFTCDIVGLLVDLVHRKGEVVTFAGTYSTMMDLTGMVKRNS